MTVDLPNVYDTLTNLTSKVLDLNLGTVWNNWNENPKQVLEQYW